MSDFFRASIDAAQQRGHAAAGAVELARALLPVSLASLVIYMAYEIVLLTWHGTTPGRRLVGISVRAAGAPGAAAAAAVVRRTFVKEAGSIVRLLPVVGSPRQPLHDPGLALAAVGRAPAGPARQGGATNVVLGQQPRRQGEPRLGRAARRGQVPRAAGQAPGERRAPWPRASPARQGPAPRATPGRARQGPAPRRIRASTRPFDRTCSSIMVFMDHGDERSARTPSVGWVLAACGRLHPTVDADRVEALRRWRTQAAAAAAPARITLVVRRVAAGRAVRRGTSREVGVGRGAGRARPPGRPSEGYGIWGCRRRWPDAAHRDRVRGRGARRVARHPRRCARSACLTLRPGRPRCRPGRAPGALAGLVDRGIEQAARRIAYRLDPHAFTARAARAVTQRRVSLRPAPDTMTFLTGLLPVAQGVAVHAALTRHADSLRSAGDQRGRGQIMADTLVEHVTGQATAVAVPVEVQLVMSDTALLGHDPTPAHVHGYGPVPAPYAPDLAGRHRRRRVGSPALHLSTRAGSGRHGLHPAHLPRRPAEVPDHSRPDLPHPLVRRPDPPPRPHHPACSRRPHHRDQRPEPVRRMQPGQGSPGWHAHTTTNGHVRTRTPTGHHYISPTPPHPRAQPAPRPQITGRT